MSESELNESTKKQIRDFLEKAIEKSKNPDPRDKIKQQRKTKLLRISKGFGL